MSGKLRGPILVAAFGVAIYCADWAFSALNPHSDTVHVERFLAVHEKFNKISYEHTDPRDERCNYALFPHGGLRPCWYVARHRSEIVDVN